MNDSSRHIFLLAVLSLGLLLLLSLVPWGSLTGNTFKDFNLFEDLMPREQNVVETPVETLPEEDFAAEEPAAEPASATADVPVAESEAAVPVVVHEEAPVGDGIVLIENYTGSSVPFEHLRAALSEASERTVRIAMLGDSYIEGDIFSQNLRDLLQQRYGGCGVGFMAMHSDFPGFRRSVRQSDSGWTMRDIRNFGRSDTLRTLANCYAKASESATAVFEGTKIFEGTKSWERSRFMFIAPDSGTVCMTVADGAEQSFRIAPSPDVQTLEVSGSTTKLSIKSDVHGIVALGAWLDSPRGVQVDCMSVRGNSGMGLSGLNRTLSTQMSVQVSYDMIILEFGMNAISAEQTEYNGYAAAMEKSVATIRACYPDADILILGVGDRGTKKGASVESLPAVAAMTQAQRRLAAKTGCLFWDICAAMGGNGAIAEWRERKLVNADYIHLNYEGGAELAALLDKAIQKSLNE